MPTKHCCHGLCNSDSRYKNKDVFFIRFPKPWIDVIKCKTWIQACRRQNFNINNITRNTYICSKHFVGENGPTPEFPNPISATASQVPKPRILKRRATIEPIVKRQYKKRKLISDGLQDEIFDNSEDVSIQTRVSEIHGVSVNTPSAATFSKCTNTVVQTADKCTGTDIYFESMHVKKLKNMIEFLKDQIKNSGLRLNTFDVHHKKFRFYTGLTHTQFNILWECLGPNKECLTLWESNRQAQDKVGVSKSKALFMTPKDQLFLTLLRLRGGFLEEDLAYRFNISQSYVSKLIITWVQFMYKQFKCLSMFPPREMIKGTLPKVFKKFRNIRIIIDGFEIRTQKPTDYREQGNMYSKYKAHSTFKILIAIIPNGGICFISDAYEGSMSDREIFIKCGIMMFLNDGDSIMVDKGFNVQDLCNEIRVNVIIPPFLKDRLQFTKEEVALTRNIACARIHVERSIGAMKQYRLLQKVLPKSLIPIISQIVFVIGCLVNFQSPLVS